MAQTNEPLLSVKGLKQYFPVSKKVYGACCG